ncbi:MAG: AI-2E family transporter [Candidatus Pacebacteria bacterium]|nr:AI-2E family transporter [Candidatus Paceibacterota bacterium]
MFNKKIGIYFLPGAILATLVLTFFIFQPFLYAVVFAIVFALVCNPINKRVSKFFGKWRTLSALVTTFIVAFGLLVPLVLLCLEIFQEVGQIYGSLTNGNGVGGVLVALNMWLADMQKFFPEAHISLVNVGEYIKQGLNIILQNFTVIFSNVTKIFMSLCVFLISLYYFIKDGAKMKKALLVLSPLDDVYDEMILNKLERSATSVVRGSLFIALIQGTVASIGFALFGIPQPVFWGSVAAFTSFIPGFGTSIVLVPAIIFLFFTHQTFQGFGLLIWAVSAVGLVDNFLAPHLIGRGMELHPLLVLLAVLGGIAFFGPSGLILGPLVVSLLFALLEVHNSSVSKEKAV